MAKQQDEAQEPKQTLGGWGWLIPALPGSVLAIVVLVGLSLYLKNVDLVPFTFLIPFLGGVGYVVTALRDFKNEDFGAVAKKWGLWMLFQAAAGFLLSMLTLPKDWNWPVWVGSAAFLAVSLILTVLFRLLGWNRRFMEQETASDEQPTDSAAGEEETAGGDHTVGTRVGTVLQQIFLKQGITNAADLTQRVIETDQIDKQQKLLHELNVAHEHALKELEFALAHRELYDDGDIKQLKQRAHNLEVQEQRAVAAAAPSGVSWQSGGTLRPF